MFLKFCPKAKIILCIILFCSTIFIIYNKYSTTEIVSKVSTSDKTTEITVNSGLIKSSPIKLYQKAENEEFKQIQSTKSTNPFYKNNEVFNINTEDKSKPTNVNNIKHTIANNHIVIDFKPAEDNGTNYEYYFEKASNKENIKTDVTKICSKSGIKGYNYVIDNNPDNEANYDVNKVNNEPILFSNIEWNKDYYLHIRAIDNNNNFSDNLTYKINLPSKGIRMQYIDINTYNKISPEETIMGYVNDEYDLSKFNKNINDYELVKVEGNEKGKLKKEKINIKYMYAKKANVVINYIDKLTGNKIKKSKFIDGYEGKEYNVFSNDIAGYKYNSGEIQGKMLAGTNEINLYYDKLMNIKISYINEITGEKILPDEFIEGIFEDSYDCKEKDIIGYEYTRTDGIKSGKITQEKTEIVHYYKKVSSVEIKYVDVDTNKLLDNKIIKGYEGDRVIADYKKIEGYILKEDYEKYNKEKNIIDEILNEEYENEDKDKEKDIDYDLINKDTIQRYDIVLQGGDTEYIIYYKRK